MIRELNYINNASTYLGSRLISSKRSDISKLSQFYSQLSDSELQVECKRRLESPEVGGLPPMRWIDRLQLQLISRLQPRMQFRHVEHSAAHLALAVECFRRIPADLPSGSVLYPEQISAARALIQPCLVQMDTGEGKTYAILPAAFCLACTFFRVYIICASNYLAWRDAARTRPFWEFVGIHPGLGVKGTRDSEWSQRVVYTTLADLMVKALVDEIQPSAPKYPLTPSAVILDEADSILLDQGNNQHSIFQPVRGDAFDWNFALDYAKNLVEGRDILVDRVTLTAALVVDVETRLRGILQAQGAQPSRILLTRYAVEVAFVATKVAEEEVDYVIEGNRLHPIDRLSGNIRRGQFESWLSPLEHARGLVPRPKHFTLHQDYPLDLLNRFAHISGTSGTIFEDSLEYLLSLMLFSIRIQPRFERRGVSESDKVYLRKENARDAVCKLICEVLEQGRSVLVGTQTIADAEQIYQIAAQQMKKPWRLELLTGKNDRAAARIFENAGEAMTATIATQLAGRGVDIRISEEVRRRGGMQLICVEHALDSRHDHQFLGRVGRQGDPFSSVFICSLEDDLLRRTGSAHIEPLMVKLGLKDDEAIEHSLVDKAIRRAQNEFRFRSFQERRYSSYLYHVQTGIYEDFRSWFEYLQLPGPGEGEENLSPDFTGRLLEHFIQQNLAPILKGENEVRREIAERVISILQVALGLKGPTCPIRALDLEGHIPETALSTLKDRLKHQLAKESERNSAVLLQARSGLAEGEKLQRWDIICKMMIRHIEALSLRLESERSLDESDPFLEQVFRLGEAEHRGALRLLPVAERFVELMPFEENSLDSIKRPYILPSLEEIQKLQMNLEEVWQEIVPPRGSVEAEEDAWKDLSYARIRIVEMLEAVVFYSQMEPSGVALQPVTDESLAKLSSELVAQAAESTDRPIEKSLRNLGSIFLSFVRRAAEDPTLSAIRVEELRYFLRQLSSTQAEIMREIEDQALHGRIVSRTPRAIGHWSLRLLWAEFLEERARILHRARQREYSVLEFHRIVSDRISEQWWRTEAGLSQSILANLLRAGAPGDLDALFYLDDHWANEDESRPPQEFEWKTSSAILFPSDSAARLSPHLLLFVSQSEPFLSSSFTSGILTRLLEDFSQHFPMHLLLSPDGIQKALESWFLLEVERGVSRERRRLNRFWLQRFLLYLHDRKLIGVLPSLRHLVRSRVRRSIKSISEIRSAFVATACVIFPVTFVLVAIWGNAFPPKTLGAWPSYIDDILFGGMLTAGNILAPALAALVLAGIVTSLLRRDNAGTFIRGTILDRFLVQGVNISVICWMLWGRNTRPSLNLLQEIGLFVLAFLAAEMTRWVVCTIQNESQINLTIPWIGYGTLFVFLPAANLPAHGHYLLLIFVALSVAAVLWDELNSAEVRLVSARMGAQLSPDETEEFSTSSRVKVGTGFTPHIFALALTWLSFESARMAFQSLTIRSWAGLEPLLIIHYFLVVTIWTRLVLARRFNLAAWREQLNVRRQILAEAQEPVAMEAMLSKLRQRLTWRELGFQAVFLFTVSTLLSGRELPGTGFPLALVVAAGAVTLALLSRDLTLEIYAFLFSRVPVRREVFNLSLLPEPEENQSLIGMIKAVAKRRTMLFLSILMFLIRISQVLVQSWKLWKKVHP
jgi:hypothetical protein